MALRQELCFLIYQRHLIKFGMRVFSSSWSKWYICDLLNVITDFLYNRKQRVVLNGQHSSWTNVESGVPHGSILRPLFFLIYINELSDGLTPNPKLFVDDTSLFSVIHNISSTGNDLNSGLVKLSNWAFQWKMRFNPDS